MGAKIEMREYAAGLDWLAKIPRVPVPEVVQRLGKDLGSYSFFTGESKIGDALISISAPVLFVYALHADNGNIDALAECVESAAKANGMSRIEFFTSRPGLVKKAAAHGYKIEGVTLSKNL